MGTWGPKLYQDDVAKDVREDFKDLLKRGKTTVEIIDQLMAKHAYTLEDSDEAPIFWFALADTQWELGMLLPFVREQALKWLAEGSNLKRWEKENAKAAVARKRALQELEQKLNSPMPPEKKISQYRLYKCEWKLGDTFAFRLESDLAREKGLVGEHFLIHKVDEYVWWPGHTIPIVRVKIAVDGLLPKDANEFNSLEYVQTAVTRYENRFLPYDGRESLEEKIRKRSKINYVVDDFGMLRQYLVKLISTSNRVFPKKLEFIGNFSDVAPPEGEFIPHVKINISSCTWKEFEKTLLEKYFGYNLRQYDFYQVNDQ